MLKLLLLPFLCISLIHAEEFSLEDDLLSSLDEVSTIASKTKLNIDDMPAFVTILKGSNLELLGIQDLYEALSLVPGVEISMEGSGAYELIFRGVKEKGKVKLLIDGVAINNSYRGSIYYYHDFPVELIDRIEVMRGPGAIYYGSNAMSGVINVITKNAKEVNDNRLFLTGSSLPSYRGGLQYNYALGEKSRLSLDAYYLYSDARIESEADRTGQIGHSDESAQNFSVGLNYSSEHLSFLARFKQSQEGLAFGLGNAFESQDDQTGSINTSVLSQLQYNNQINESNHYSLSLGLNNYRQEIETRFLPTSSGDLIYKNSYAESSVFTEGTLNSSQFDHHSLVLGVRYEYAQARHNELNTYNENTPSIPFLPTETLIQPDAKRHIFSLYVNDSIELGEKVDVVGGLRWDNYSDFGHALSPRLGIIYRAIKEYNIKLLYSRAYRAPSWLELYATIPGISVGDPSLQAETSDTLELGNIYRPNNDQTLRLNLYVSQIDNLIVRDAALYQQSGKNYYYGAEAEWIASLGIHDDIKTTLSYVEAIDNNNSALPNIANLLANISYIHSFDFGIKSGTLLKYVSARSRAENDSRDALEGYALLDQSFSYTYKAVNLTASVKNIFDINYAYPAPANTYVNDYVREGRSYWLSGRLTF